MLEVDVKRAGLGLALWLMSAAAHAAEPTLLSAGAEPRSPVRMSVPVGAKATTHLSMDMTVITQILGSEAVTKVPHVNATVNMDVPHADDSRYDVHFVYADVEVGKGDAMGRMVAEQLKGAMSGAEGTLTVSTRGELLEAALGTNLSGGSSGDEGLDLARWVVGFPEAPIGVGASWTVTDDSTGDQGLTVHTLTTYTVLARDAGSVTMQIEGSSKAEPGKMKVQGQTVNVSKLETTSKGVVVVRVDQPFAESGAWTVNVDMLVKMGSVSVPQKTTLDIKIGAPTAKGK